MAEYPCDLHHGRYPGDANRVYFNAFHGDQVLSLKLSVCDQDLDLLLEPWTSEALAKDEQGRWIYLTGREELIAAWRAYSGDSERFSRRNGQSVQDLPWERPRAS